MAEVTPLFTDTSSVFSGDELGLPYRYIVSEGILTAGSLLVSQRGAGANLSVDVAAGSAYVLGDTNVTRQPNYLCINDAVVNKGITPDAANPRKVLVVAQVTDEGFSGTGRNWEIVAIHGTPAGSPVEPSLPASALPLALIDVTAADASIIDNQITDRRVLAATRPSAIYDITLATTAASIDIQNIPQVWNHLELVVYARTDTAAVARTPLSLRFNNDSGSSYDWQLLTVNNATLTGTAAAAQTQLHTGEVPAVTASANRFGNSRILIPHYANTTQHKNLRATSGLIQGTTTADCFAYETHGHWRSTAAINRLQLVLSSGNFIAGTRVTLYGK